MGKNEIELKPCPACGGYPEIGGNVDGTEMWIACGNLRKCRMGGPTRSTVEEAAQAWNDLPRALVWSSEPPSEPGFWWWELLGYKGVDLIKDPEKRVVKDYRARWAGPIPEPKTILYPQLNEERGVITFSAPKQDEKKESL